MLNPLRIMMVVVMMLVVALITDSEGANNCCMDCTQCSGDYGSCIHNRNLCNDVKDCPHGEDEHETFCNVFHNTECPRGEAFCSNRCRNWQEVCSRNMSHCPTESYYEFCQTLTKHQFPSTLALHGKASPPNIHIEQAIEYLQAGNCSQTPGNTTKCPMLYADVKGTCLALLPFELPWSAANQICRSISGTLLEFKDGFLFSVIVQHLINTGFASDFWTGGFFDPGQDAWAWSTGSKMPTSTPYWTLRYNSTCQSSQSSDDKTSVPGCSHYQQAPVAFKASHCAALTHRYRYYISDEPCFEKKFPLCIVRSDET